MSNSQLSINLDSADFDSDSAVTEINAYIAKISELSEHKNLLISYLHNGDEPVDSIYDAIEKLNSYVDTKNLISSFSTTYIKQFDFLYTDLTTDWDNIVDLLKKLADIKQSALYEVLCPTINVPANRKQNYKVLSTKILDIYNAGLGSFEWVQSQFSTDTRLDMMAIKSLAEKISGCLENIDILEGWIDYTEAKEDCENNGLSDFIRKIEDAELFTSIERIFLKGFYHMWLGAVCDKSALIAPF